MARLHREKLGLLLDELVGGRFAVGELLSREVDLAEELNVSRGVAREVVRALEERGVVVVRHGSGATVTPVEDWNVLDRDVLAAVLKGRDGRVVFGNVHEPRRLLEPTAARFAAERDSGDELRAIDQELARLDAAPKRDYRARGMAELDLHRAIVRAAGNLPWRPYFGRCSAGWRRRLPPSVAAPRAWRSTARSEALSPTATQPGPSRP